MGLGLALGVVGVAGAASADRDWVPDAAKVTICHATNSEDNPYEEIEVALSSVDGNGHGGHTGPLWYAGAKAAGVGWGDVIPPIEGVTLGLNWPEGELTFSNEWCDLVIPEPITDEGDDRKVVICHATNSESNPYNQIEVSVSAVDGHGHANHTGPVWYPGAKDDGVRWGDIIPPVDGVTTGLNWPAGTSTFNNGCELPGVDAVTKTTVTKEPKSTTTDVTTTTEATTTTEDATTTTTG